MRRLAGTDIIPLGKKLIDLVGLHNAEHADRKAAKKCHKDRSDHPALDLGSLFERLLVGSILCVTYLLVPLGLLLNLSRSPGSLFLLRKFGSPSPRAGLGFSGLLLLLFKLSALFFPSLFLRLFQPSTLFFSGFLSYLFNPSALFFSGSLLLLFNPSALFFSGSLLLLFNPYSLCNLLKPCLFRLACDTLVVLSRLTLNIIPALEPLGLSFI